MNEKYNEFLKIAKKLNEELNIIPLLYGSLGLQIVTDIDFNADDIDILIPGKYLSDNWNILKETIEGIGYKLTDLHEHEFVKENYRIAFADIESLIYFANIDIELIAIKDNKEIKYKLLNLEEYLKVYLSSSKDGYRKTKNNNKDIHKIELIKQLISRNQNMIQCTKQIKNLKRYI